MKAASTNKPKLFLVCTGLGIVQRGFETFIADLAEKLASETQSFDTNVFSGGTYKTHKFKSTKLLCIHRNNNWFNKLFGFSTTSELEQISFFVSFIRCIILNRPSAIYLGEYKLYCYLFKFRQLLQLQYSLVLYTGGQVSPGLFDPQKDYVHHITDVYYSDLVRAGYPSNRQFVLPHFMSSTSEISTAAPKLKGYNVQGKKIIISIGLIDKAVKRMDCFVNVLAQNASLYFPIILGESTVDTPEIENMLIRYFGKGNYFLGKVERSELHQYLHESDLFMLLSPKESFGLAALEALSIGLPVICCEYHESKFVLKDAAYLTNCTDELSIIQLLNKILSEDNSSFNKTKRIEFVRNNYSWDVLKDKYLAMFNAVVRR
jgi:1,2-diacylglycerol 3-alpha-glucosyltransferase